VWQAASVAEQTKLKELVCCLQTEVLKKAPVWILDRIDKLIWLANGDPMGLGFRWQ
jgi:hypothetical protein